VREPLTPSVGSGASPLITVVVAGELRYRRRWAGHRVSARIPFAAPCSNGSLVSPEGQTTVNFTTPINARSYPEIEVTREADAGNPQASGEKVLEGELPA
jgi:hypothetical protein